MNMRPHLLIGMLIASVSGCAGGASDGPPSEASLAAIKVGTAKADVIDLMGQPLATRAVPGLGATCLQYELGQPERPRPYYVVVTPNDRVYESGYDNCAAIARS